MKRVLIFFISLIVFVFGLNITVFAAEYEDNYPNYIPISGGAYIEVKCSLGTAALVFPSEYKNGYFGFVNRSDSAFGNIHSGTINGYVYTSNGQIYIIRASYGQAVEFRTSNTYPYDWVDISIRDILNTNIMLIDDTDLNRQNDLIYYDFTYFERAILSCVIALCITDLVFKIIMGAKLCRL